MKINGVDQQQNINPVAAGRNDRSQRVDGMSFLDMMKLRSLQGTQATSQTESIPESETSVLPMMDGLFEIEAIAAKSRVQYVAGGDVSDFLELVEQKPLLLDGLDLSTLPASSSGTHVLDAAMINSLSEKYDVNNLSRQEQLDLLSELVEAGVLTKSDVMNLQKTVSPSSDDLMGYLVSEPQFKDAAAQSETQPLKRLDAMISNERFAYDHVQDRYGQRCTSVKELADSHQRVADTLRKLER